MAVAFPPGRVETAAVRLRPGTLPALLSWDAFAIESGPLDALKRLQRERRLGARCTALLQHGQYQLIQMEAPDGPVEERADALRWRIKEMLTFPVEQAGIEVIDIPRPDAAPGRPAQVLLVAADEAVLKPLVQSFQAAKAPLQIIDIPELAQRNVAALFETENRGLALLAFAESGACLTVTYRGELYVARHIDVSAAELAAAGRAGGGGVFERILLDVQRTLDNFDRNFSFISLSRVLVTPIPGAENFIPYLGENLLQSVDALALEQVMDIAAVPALKDAGRQAEALLAIGAALRGEAA